MNRLTSIKTITKAAPLALLAVVMSGSAFAGPQSDRPTGKKLSIDVNNYCYFDGNPRYLVIETTATASGSEFGDNNGYIVDFPTVDAAFKANDDCKPVGKSGKQACNTYFKPVGDPKDMYEAGGFTWAADSTSPVVANGWKKKLDLCDESSDIHSETAVNALVKVVVTDKDGSTTWASTCDDIWFDEHDDDPYDDGVDRVDHSDLNLDEVGIYCGGD